MASTNKTTNYDLSQYVGSDKPTYLVDYNGDMLKIDNGIAAAKAAADDAELDAATAINNAANAQETANTAVTNAATADGKATAANTNIGEMASLQTTAKTDLVSAINEIFNKLQPVGSVYISTDNIDPSIKFGFGTWVQIKERFLLGAGEAFELGSTGGEVNHTLTVNEMPTHSHTLADFRQYGTGSATDSEKLGRTQPNADGGGAIATEVAGGNQPHNNMPPYVAVSIWKRTA